MTNATSTPEQEADAARHREKMQKRKAVQDREVASKTVEKGLLMVNTGPGKGKSTAAFGMVLRTLGYGRKVVVVQFIKGAWDTGEHRALQRFDDLVEWHALGEGFTWETQDRTRDIAACEKAWAVAKAAFQQPDVALVVLDELNVALRYDYLPLAQVVADIQARTPGQHVLVTGRNAKPEMLEAADLVTEMALVKHHFRNGVKAQQGVEF